MVLQKTLAVQAIKSGTVIDHIPTGNSLKIVKLLRLETKPKQISLGLNLESSRMERKDIIKIEGFELEEKKAEQISLFALHATVNIIQNFEVVRKYTVKAPTLFEELLYCPNNKCITHFEKMFSRFLALHLPKATRLKCHYCAKQFTPEEMVF